MFSGTNHSGQETMRALERARAYKDISQVPVIIELMQFVGSSVLLQESIATLQELTGQRFDATNAGWTSWRVWLGEHVAEFQPPPDYLRWKVNVLSLIHPRFEEFLLPHGETARINLTEIVWGGVVPDGIPDLQNPETLSPDEADYLFPEDRVFGVSINGEHRAYPLRILNPHEMANDVLGGEPIAWPIEHCAAPESCIPRRSTVSRRRSAHRGCCTEATRLCTTVPPGHCGISSPESQ